MTGPLVSVGVPVFRGTAHVAETLRSIQAQTHRALDVLISVDGADRESAGACEPFLADPRFRMVVQERQLGWAANISLLMQECAGDYWYYHQQDDLITPDYVEVLAAHAAAHPEAAVVFADIQAFGTIDRRLFQGAVLGPPAVREIALLLAHHSAVAFRGLTRRAALAEAGGVRANEIESFSADTTWMASVARAGELHRVAKVLYFKRFHPANVHSRWAEWPLDRRMAAWRVHCRDMFLEAVGAGTTLIERRLIFEAALARLVATDVARGYIPVRRFTDADRVAMLEAFLAELAPRAGAIEPVLGAPFADIADGARRLFAGAQPSA